MADTAPVMIWMSDNHKLCTYFNKVWLEFTGRSLEQELGNGWAEGVHPDDYQRCLETYETAFDACRVFKMEYRLRRFDGQYGWVLDSGIPRYLPDGSFLGYIGSAIDITDRKRTEEALRRSEATLRENQNYLRFLAGKLLTAQEEERRLLARELHDDVSQRLAAVAIDVGIFERQMKSLPEPVRKQLWEIEGQLVELSTEIHNLSRQLHPSIIDDLGLVDAIQSECNRFSVRERILVEFAVKHAPKAMPKDVALCLYRITQESLRNIAKHAQTEKAHVSLSGDKNSISLSIQDSGVGFDPVSVRRNGGLGFASMKERAQLIQGDLSIQSHPGQGTVIEVRVPLAKRNA
jgi:PAS domain S-box-containing protein